MVQQKYVRFPFADIGNKVAVPNELDPAGSVSYTEGWGPDYERDPVTDPLAKRIPRDQSNQLMYDVTSNIQQYQLESYPRYVMPDENGGAPVAYSMHVRVRYDDGSGVKVYASTIDNNTSLPSVFPDWVIDDPFRFNLLSATRAELRAGTILTRFIVPGILSAGIQSGEWTYAIAAGTANALTLPLVPALLELTEGAAFRLKVAATNTAAATLKINALAAYPITRLGGGALQAGDLVAGDMISVMYKANAFQITTPIRAEAAQFASEAEMKQGTITNKAAAPATTASPVQDGSWVFATAAGPANALTINLTPAITAYTPGMSLTVLISATNTAAPTINVNGVGATQIWRPMQDALRAGDLQAGDIATIVYNGVAFVLTSYCRSLANRPDKKHVATTTQNWVVPDGVTRVYARVWGGGGSGGRLVYAGESGTGGGGGGGGAYCEGGFDVTPGQVLALVVGGGGAAGGGGGQIGNPGGTSEVTGIIAAGGGGGAGAGGNGGAGGAAFGGLYQLAIPGSQGTRAVYNDDSIGPGRGGSAFSGPAQPDLVNAPGQFPGGGGNGGGGPGGTGGNGLIIIDY